MPSVGQRTWPDGTPKSQQNAFTAHITQPTPSIRFAAKTGPKPAGVQHRYQQDAEKARIYTLGGPQ